MSLKKAPGIKKKGVIEKKPPRLATVSAFEYRVSSD